MVLYLGLFVCQFVHAYISKTINPINLKGYLKQGKITNAPSISWWLGFAIHIRKYAHIIKGEDQQNLIFLLYYNIHKPSIPYMTSWRNLRRKLDYLGARPHSSWWRVRDHCATTERTSLVECRSGRSKHHHSLQHVVLQYIRLENAERKMLTPKGDR